MNTAPINNSSNEFMWTVEPVAKSKTKKAQPKQKTIFQENINKDMLEKTIEKLTASLLERIANLEKEVKDLKEENDTLKIKVATLPST